MDTTYIILPGLGDDRPFFYWFYESLAKRWTKYGMYAHVLSPEWASDELYEQKYQRLAIVIAKERSQGREVVLVGVSAGATLGLLAFTRQPNIKAFISVCGFTQLKPLDRANNDLMKLSWYQAAAAAEKELRLLGVSKRKQILSLIPLADNVIEPAQQQIEGATNSRLKIRGHLLGIVVALYGRRRFIRRFVSSIS